jgi:uncharacterized protein YkwD
MENTERQALQLAILAIDGELYDAARGILQAMLDNDSSEREVIDWEKVKEVTNG